MGSSQGRVGAERVDAENEHPTLTGSPALAAARRSGGALTHSTPAISMLGVTKRYGHVDAVKRCTLEIERGTFVSILGPSGCGKTTLLRMIGGFLRPDSGRILIHGEDVTHEPPNRRDVNTVFQRYALFPNRSVAGNVAFPLEVQRVPRRERAERVAQMLELVDLHGAAERRPSQLSGGQAQRVALARALVGQPEVLLLDEPLTALDLKLRQSMRVELRRIHEEIETTFLFVTHDQEEAMSMSTRIILMRAGEVVQDGTPQELYHRPSSIFASRFIGEANLLYGDVVVSNDTMTVVRCAGRRVIGGRATAAQGQSVAVSVRPEQVRLTVGPWPGGDANAIEGVVRDRVFLGSVTRVIVEIDRQPEGFVVDCPPGVPAPERGSRVAASWPIDATVVLPVDGQ